MAGPTPSVEQDQNKAPKGPATAAANLTRAPAAAPAGRSNSAGLAGPSRPSGFGNAQVAALQSGAAAARDAGPGGPSQPVGAADRISPKEALFRARQLLKSRAETGRGNVKEFWELRDKYHPITGPISDWFGSITHNVTPPTLRDFYYVDILVGQATEAGEHLQWPTCGRLLSEAAFELQRLERQMAEAREGGEVGADRAVDLLHTIQALVVIMLAPEVVVAALGEGALAAPLFSGTSAAAAGISGLVFAGAGGLNETAEQLAARGRVDWAAVLKRILLEFGGTFFGHFANGLLLRLIGGWLTRFVSRELIATGLPARALGEGEQLAVQLLSGALATPFTTALGVVTERYIGGAPWPTAQEFVEQVMGEIPKGVLIGLLLHKAPQAAPAKATATDTGTIVLKPPKAPAKTEPVAPLAQTTEPTTVAASAASATPEDVIAREWLAANKPGPASAPAEARVQLPAPEVAPAKAPPAETEGPITVPLSGASEQKPPGVSINLNEPEQKPGITIDLNEPTPQTQKASEPEPNKVTLAAAPQVAPAQAPEIAQAVKAVNAARLRAWEREQKGGKRQSKRLYNKLEDLSVLLERSWSSARKVFGQVKIMGTIKDGKETKIARIIKDAKIKTEEEGRKPDVVVLTGFTKTEAPAQKTKSGARPIYKADKADLGDYKNPLADADVRAQTAYEKGTQKTKRGPNELAEEQADRYHAMVKDQNDIERAVIARAKADKAQIVLQAKDPETGELIWILVDPSNIAPSVPLPYGASLRN